MGNADPRSFSRGKRGIAGTLVFAQFDHDALLVGLQDHLRNNKVFHRIGGDINTKAMTIEEWDAQMSNLANKNSGSNTTTQDAVQRTQAVAIKTDPVIADEIPPFDITISMANEYGKAAVMILYGVEILNQGGQYSMDNIMTQQACTFVARRLKTISAVQVTSN
jgi:hypothetical protein